MSRLATATLVVAYRSSDDSKIIKAEIDPEKHSGSSFAPGSAVYFRVFANCDYEFHLSDNSTVTLDGNGVADIENENIQFVQRKETNIGYPYSSGWSFSWWGTPGYTAPSAPAVNDTLVGINTTANEETLVAVGKANYKSNYKRYRLNPASSDEGYTVVILILEKP